MLFTRCMCVRETVCVMVSFMKVVPPSLSLVSLVLLLISVPFLTLPTLSNSSVTPYSISIFPLSLFNVSKHLCRKYRTTKKIWPGGGGIFWKEKQQTTSF